MMRQAAALVCLLCALAWAGPPVQAQAQETWLVAVGNNRGDRSETINY